MRRQVKSLLALDKKSFVAWCTYDWANSAFTTTVMAAVAPIFFADVAAADLPEATRSAYWAYAASFSLFLAAIIAPPLGALADYLPLKKFFTALFAFVGAAATALLFFVGKGDWALMLGAYVVACTALSSSFVFYESILPHLAKGEDIDRVSLAGYAYGYIGGGILLAVNLAWIMKPQWFGISSALYATQLSFLSVALWWLLFTLPLIFAVPEPKSHLAFHRSLRVSKVVREAFIQLHTTFILLLKERNLMLFLAAFWLYNDGINTIIKMAAIYGREIGIGKSHLIGALLLVQFLGFPATLGFVPFAHRWGAKKAVIFSLLVYAAISVLGYFMTTALHFWILAVAVALVQGSSQALSRSLFASMIPPRQSAELFAFFSVSSKFAGILGPLLFGIVSQLTGQSRLSILILVLFFIVGIALLSKVDTTPKRRHHT